MKRTVVTYFFRKPRPQYFSIEKVFEAIISNLPSNIQPEIYKLKNGTNGWYGRLKALVEVWKNKGEINHITGDITFVALALPRKGLIVTYHDLESLTAYKGWRFNILKLLWVSIPVKRAQIVTAISEHTKNRLIEWTGCNPNKIVVIPNPLPNDLEYYPKQFDDKAPCILVIGTKSNKNVEGIFEAVGSLISKKQCEDNIRIILVGKITRKQQDLISRYNLRIENLVHVPYEQIIDAYKRCDILCFPSFYEGFGLPIIEAQAIGRPVITSNFGAMKEVAGDSALLVCPDSIEGISNSILELIDNNILRIHFIEKGLKNVERFNIVNIVKSYSKVYCY